MFETIIHWTTATLELAGIFAMTLWMLLASLAALVRAARGKAGVDAQTVERNSPQCSAGAFAQSASCGSWLTMTATL